MAPLFSSTGGSATGTQASGGGSRTQRLKRKAQELKERAERRIQPQGGGGGSDDTGDGETDDGSDLDPGESQAPDTERVSRAKRKAENRSRIQRLKQQAKRKVGLDDGESGDGNGADPQRVQARQEQLRSRQFDSRRQAKIAAAQRKIQGIAQAARDASASVDPDGVGQDMTMQASPGRERALAEGDPGVADEFDPAPGPSRMGATDRGGYEPVPGPSRRTAEDRALDPDAVGGEDPVPGNGVVGSEIQLDEQPTLGGSFGAESRVDLANPQTQRELERQAETDLVDAAGNVGEAAIDVGADAADAVGDAADVALSNPYKTAAATVASPVPGDEVVGLPMALLAAGGTAAVGLSRTGSEIPVPSNPFNRGTNEIPVGEQFPIKETVTPDVGRPAEITIPEGNFQEPELPVGESVQDQPEIAIGGDAGTGQGTPTRQRPADSVVPENYPSDPRRRPSVRRQILQRDAGAVGVGTGTGTDLGDAVGDDLATPDQPSIDDGGREVPAQREFPTGEQAVVGEGVASENPGTPEVTVEDDPLSITTGEVGLGSQFGPGLGSVTEPTFGPEAGAPSLPQNDTTPDLQSGDGTGDGLGTGTGTGPGVGTGPVPGTVTGTPTQFGTPTANPPGMGNPGTFDPGFEQPPGYPTEFGPGSGDPSRRRRPPSLEFEPDPQDERRRRDPGGLAVFENPIASAEEVVGTPSGDPVGLDLGGDAADYDPTGFSLDLDGDGGVL